MADLLHQGISLFFQILPVSGEGIMLPYVQGIPGIARNVPGPPVAAEDVLGSAHRPAAHRLAVLGIEFFIGLGGVPAAGSHGFHVINQRLVAFGKIGGFRAPVGHLDIDVVVIVAGPRRTHVFVPKALEVCGKGSGPGAGKQQIAAELEHGLLQVGIGRLIFVGFQAFRNGKFGHFRLSLAEVHFHAVKHGLVLGDVRLFQRGIIRRGGFGRITVQLLGRGLPLPVFLVVHQVVRLHGDDNRAGIRVFHGNPVPGGGNGAPLRAYQDAAFKIHAVLQGTFPRKYGAFGGDVRIHLAIHGKVRVETAGLAGAVVDHQDIGGGAGKSFTVVGHAVGFVIHLVNAVAQVQGAGEVLHGHGGGLVPFLEVHEQVAERHVVAELVGPRIRTVAVAASRVGAAGPEADLVQGKTFTVGGTENHRAHAAVADGIAFRFPYGGGLLVFAKAAVRVFVRLWIDDHGRLVVPDQVGGGRLVQSAPAKRYRTYG